MALVDGSDSAEIKDLVKEDLLDSTEDSGKVVLSDLKVNELRAELDKRDLDKSGNKSALIERLKKAMEGEGKDPDDTVFKAPLPVEDQSTKKKNSNANGVTSSPEKDGVIEIKDSDVNLDDKNANEVTLQISIDEEDAQLNDDDNLDLNKCNDVESCVKIENKVTVSICDPSASDMSKLKQSESEKSPSKLLKSCNEEVKEKKVKTPTQNKLVGNSSVSPKVLKVLGKSDKVKNPNVLAKSLWVTGLPNTTRAADLKVLFSKQGKVLSVKIVKSTKQTPGKCYGFVTMAASKDATKAIQNLHRIELNGRIISVERTQSEPSMLLKKTESKTVTVSSKKAVVKKETAKVAEVKSTSNTESKSISKSESKSVESKSLESSTKVKDIKKSNEKSKSKEKEREHKTRDHRKDERRSVRRPPPPSYRSRPFSFADRSRLAPFRSFSSRVISQRSGLGLSFRSRLDMSLYDRMREDRLRRERLRERELREVEKQRALDISRHRYIERKQREEADRLEREKLKLRIEREILEREKAEMLRLEREKQRLERERLERERELLKRQAELRRVSKRAFERTPREPDNFWNERRKTPRYEERPSFRTDTASTSRHEYPPRERSYPARSTAASTFDRHPAARFASTKVEATPRTDFGDRDSRREVTIRTREVRQVYQQSDVRDRNSRRSFPTPKERERPAVRHEPSRNEWKHERRVHERVVNSSGSTVHRRVNYY